jgi:putative transposase
MRNLVVLFIHFIAILARLLEPGGVRSLVAESLLLKHQLLIVNRSRQRSPNLRPSDRILAGLMTLWVRPTRLLRSAIVLKPSTLLGLQKAMSKQKYRMLFSPDRRRKPGPKGPSAELIRAVVEMKQRNPHWGCPRIAQPLALAFHIPIDKDVVRRILAHHHRPGQGSGGPSWLTFLGHMKDSRWSIDLFRCESATLRSHWVLVVMDQSTRRIIGFGVQAGTVDGVALCRMFNRAIRGQRQLPNYLSSDNDPLYRFHQWQANLRILEVTEIKTVPYVPVSHPFVERLIGTLRREYLDHMLFWTTADLENKLLDFRTYFNHQRTHTSREGCTPDTPVSRPIANLRSFRWQPHCRSL